MANHVCTVCGKIEPPRMKPSKKDRERIAEKFQTDKKIRSKGLAIGNPHFVPGIENEREEK